jgi:hypothetical protein
VGSQPSLGVCVSNSRGATGCRACHCKSPLLIAMVPVRSPLDADEIGLKPDVRSYNKRLVALLARFERVVPFVRPEPPSVASAGGSQLTLTVAGAPRLPASSRAWIVMRVVPAGSVTFALNVLPPATGTSASCTSLPLARVM